MRSSDRLHHPHSAGGTADRLKMAGGNMPSAIASSWPAKSAFIPTGKYQRKAMPRNPDCLTNKVPHRELTRSWLRDKMPLALVEHLVRTSHEGDALYQRALNVYRAMVLAMPESLRPTDSDYAEPACTFPIMRQDMASTIQLTAWLDHSTDTE